MPAHLISTTLSLLLALFAFAGAASGQSVYVDYGSATPAPSSAYAGAAAQPGVWNTVTGLEREPVALVDTTGAPTAVTIEPDLPFGPATFDQPATSGDLQALLDDYLDLHSVPSFFHVHGLAAGTYHVTTYAWAPDESAFKTAVTVNGFGAQLVGGAWPGALTPGITHATHSAGIADGETLDIRVFGIGKGTLNGLQLERVGSAFADLGGGLEGEAGLPELFLEGETVADAPIAVALSRAAAFTPVTMVLGLSRLDATFKGGVLVPSVDLLLALGPTGEEGTLALNGRWPQGVPSSATFYMQCWMPDAAAPQGYAASNAVQALVP